MNMFMTDISISCAKIGLSPRCQIANGCIFPLLPVSVVLLDTTSVLGELGWKTYPINGVRRETLLLIIAFVRTVQCVLFKMRGHYCFSEINYIDVNRSGTVAMIY